MKSRSEPVEKLNEELREEVFRDNREDPDDEYLDAVRAELDKLSGAGTEETVDCPMELFTSLKYRDMTAESKIVYILMLYRLESRPEIDEDGKKFILMPIGMFIQSAGIRKKKLMRAIRELESYDLICRRHHRTDPTQIYVKSLAAV